MSDEDAAAKRRIAADILREAQGDEDDLVARFPDPERDERLRTPRAAELPEVPQARFEPPKTNTARGGGGAEGGDSLRMGRAGAVSGREIRGMGAGYMIGISLVTSILVGTGLGWLVDRYLLHNPATPWGLIVGFLLGVVSGFVQVIQIANRLNRDR